MEQHVGVIAHFVDLYVYLNDFIVTAILTVRKTRISSRMVIVGGILQENPSASHQTR